MTTLKLACVLALAVAVAACSSPVGPSQQVDYTVTAPAGTHVVVSATAVGTATTIVLPTSGEWDWSVTLTADQAPALTASAPSGCLSVQMRTYAPVSVKTDTECGTPVTASVR